VSEIKQVLKVLSRAIIRETTAFNHYYKGSEDATLPPGVRGLLSRLAEEERKHRRLLVDEYRAVEKGWDESHSDPEKGSLSYTVPGKLPYVPIETSGDLEITAVSLPARLVGGDNILSTTIRDRSGGDIGTFLLLYDAMGHSLDTTELNAIAARLLGEYIDPSFSSDMRMELLSPKKVVRYLNAGISEAFEGQGVFLTLLSALFDAKNKMLSYTLAGHEPPFLVHDRGRVGSLLNTQLIVGIDPEFQYRENKVPFEKGDILCIFSDGIIEAVDPDGDIFGRERVAAILEKHWKSPAKTIVKEMLGDLDRFCSGRPLNDEVSIMIIRSKGD